MAGTINFFKKANRVADLSDISFLSELLGPVRTIEKQPLKTSGFSGSAHEKLSLQLHNGETLSLVLKTIQSAMDMTIWRSGNIHNREALILDTKEMAGVWNFFQPPYIAYAIEENNSALLMHDLSQYLFPDIRQPVKIEEENLLLHTLARMHAHYWQHELLFQSWLAKQEIFFSFLGPHTAKEEKIAGREHPIFELVQNGWDLAFEFLPAELGSFLLDPPIEKITDGLPKTLIHGDSKIANFAMLPDKKLTAFDWTMVGSACPACEIGWYISVNASRLARSKEAVLSHYRELLETELKQVLADTTWHQMTDVAILTGATTLLWNKALNLKKNIPGATEEWNWWVENIRVCKKKY